MFYVKDNSSGFSLTQFNPHQMKFAGTSAGTSHEPGSEAEVAIGHFPPHLRPEYA